MSRFRVQILYRYPPQERLSPGSAREPVWLDMTGKHDDAEEARAAARALGKQHLSATRVVDTFEDRTVAEFFRGGLRVVGGN